MYWCNAREYLLLYEAFMLIIDYLFSERIFFNAGDRLIHHMAFLQNESFMCLQVLPLPESFVALVTGKGLFSSMIPFVNI